MWDERPPPAGPPNWGRGGGLGEWVGWSDWVGPLGWVGGLVSCEAAPKCPPPPIAKQRSTPRGFPAASERGTKLEVAHKWAGWLHNPCRMGVSQRFKISNGRPHSACHRWFTHPLSTRFLSASIVDFLPVVNNGPGGYITRAARGVPNALEQVTKSAMAHNWAGWLHNLCRLEVPHHFRAGDKIRGGPQVGRVST